MPQYWLLKTEPSTYAYADLEREGRTVWEGVTNNLALKHLRSMQKGDLALVYHTGDEKAVVGVADIASNPYADPKQKDPRIVVVDVKPREKLRRPVPLAEIKGDSCFADFALVRLSRLSVMPISEAHWKRLLKMGSQGL